MEEKKKCVYLDFNGTTPVYPPVLEAMLPYLTDHFGNPSSSHHFGSEPKAARLRGAAGEPLRQRASASYTARNTSPASVM